MGWDWKGGRGGRGGNGEGVKGVASAKVYGDTLANGSLETELAAPLELRSKSDTRRAPRTALASAKVQGDTPASSNLDNRKCIAFTFVFYKCNT